MLYFFLVFYISSMINKYLPKHVVIIPDGNRRWAKERRFPVFKGHAKGSDVVLEISRKAREMGIKILSIWGFSTENWTRSKREVNLLMKVFEKRIDKQLDEAMKEKVRMIHIGRKMRINSSLRKKIENAEKQTKHFKNYYFVFALDYGGRDEVLRAIKRINDKDKSLDIDKLTEDEFSKYLDTKDLPNPNPDLVIRTSGETRTSGFMIWQAAYSEYIFLKKYFPDFNKQDFENCILEYSNRKRRFGR